MHTNSTFNNSPLHLVTSHLVPLDAYTYINKCLCTHIHALHSCMHAYFYIYTHIRAYMHTHTYTHTSTWHFITLFDVIQDNRTSHNIAYKQARIHTDIQTYTNKYIHTYKHTNIQTYTHTNIQTYIHVRAYVCTYVRHT